MADYVGALAAIKARVTGNWTTTPLAFSNENMPDPKDTDGNPVPWVFFEIVSSGSDVVGSGVPGNQVIRYQGLIKCHVFVPTDTGIEVGFTHSVALGDIFKNQVFYNDTDGHYVRTLFPRIDEGTANSDDGLWYSVTATIPFEYWHRG